MKSGFKVKRRQKKGGKSREKNFKKKFVDALLLGGSFYQSKSNSFLGKFFEFEEFWSVPFFLGSI